MRTGLSAFLLLSLTACSKPATEFPIDRPVLPEVLVEVYTAEAKAKAMGTSLVDARVGALRKHGYDTVAFNETMRVLTEDPEEAKKVYQAVLDSVIFAQRDIRAKALADSL